MKRIFFELLLDLTICSNNFLRLVKRSETYFGQIYVGFLFPPFLHFPQTTDTYRLQIFWLVSENCLNRSLINRYYLQLFRNSCFLKEKTTHTFGLKMHEPVLQQIYLVHFDEFLLHGMKFWLHFLPFRIAVRIDGILLRFGWNFEAFY